MVDSDIQHEPDVDNWFDEPDTSGALDERSARLVRSKQHESPAGERGADWVVADTAPTTGERLPIRVPELLRSRRAVPVAALVLVACLLGGLAAAGVFSGSSRHATTTPPATTGAPATTTTPQVTPTQPGDQYQVVHDNLFWAIVDVLGSGHSRTWATPPARSTDSTAQRRSARFRASSARTVSRPTAFSEPTRFAPSRAR